MAKVEEVNTIHAPIEEVFAALTDPRRAMEWNPSILEVRDISGPLQEGTTWRQTAVLAGKRAQLDCRVSAYQPPHRGVIEVTGGQQGRVWTQCEPVEGGTRVTQGIEFALPGGLLGGLAAGPITGMVRGELQRAMRRQRETLEAEAGGNDGSGTA